MMVLAKAAKIGYKLGRDKRYKRMGAKGATGHYRLSLDRGNDDTTTQ